MRKTRKVLSLIAVALIGFLGVFTFSACGSVSLNTIETNFTKLEEKYKKYDNIFTFSDVHTSSNYLSITYGKVDDYLSEDNYKELEEIYRVTLSISSDYIDSNKTYILNYTKKLASAGQKSLNNLNKTLVDYTKEIDNFASARDNLEKQFLRLQDSQSNDALAVLRNFKKSYGTLVEKNVAVSVALAESIENTELFDILQQTQATKNDSKILKEYIRAKLLPIFSNFMIKEMENKLNWNATDKTATKERIDTVLLNLKNQFDFYKSNYASDSKTYKELTTKEMSDFLSMIKKFLVEVESYNTSLFGLDINKLASLSYRNNMEEYKNSNKNAEIYLEKLEQFTSQTLPKFMERALLYIYE